jgi:hypothetical protein
VIENHKSDHRRKASTCSMKHSLCAFVIPLILASNCAIHRASASSHKSHSGAQRYDDVVIIRHADGTIESRDASPSRVTYDGGSVPSSSQHHSARTSHGGKPPAKVSSRSTTGKPKQLAHAKSTSNLSTKHSHSGSAQARASLGDDVEIIRNSDGSVEARDAQ